MKLGSLFDGIGGALLAASMCEIEPVWSSEIEPFPIKVTKHHFPDVKHLGDITKINGAEIEPVDIIVGGSPCQDLSVAGKRAGLAGERSGLFMEQIRIVKEMRSETNKPRYMVWENVPGAFSSNGGEDFRAVLEETARVADPTVSIPRSVDGWANAGSILADEFSISWRTFDAQYWGVPQRRRRIYLVADFGGQSAPEILFESESVSGDIAEGRGERQGTAKDAERSVGEAVAIDAYNHAVTGDIAVTLTAESGSSATHSGPMCMVAPLNTTDRHAVCYGLSSFASNAMKSNNPHSGIYEADTARTIDQNGGNPACNQGGIMVFEPRSQDGVPRVSQDGNCPTLNTAQGGQRQPCVVYESHPMDSRITGPHNISPTVTNHFHKGGADTPLVLDRASFNQGKNALYEPLIEQSEVCPTVISRGPCAVYSMQRSDEYVAADVTSTESARQYKSATDLVTHTNAVRRLTPLECERLQGYPDNYTNIPGASDSARYKALGNSFAIPNVYFVISKIKEVNND